MVGSRATPHACRRVSKGYAAILGVLLLVCAAALTAKPLQAATFLTPTRSTTIALTSDDRLLLVVNRETDSLTIIEVRNAEGEDRRRKIAEVAVGKEPRCVAISPDDREAYVANAVSGTVSVIALTGAERFRVVDEIRAGTELRGCALTPNGTVLYVANHTEGTVSAISTANREVLRKIRVGGNPMAIAITNNRDEEDRDERVFVTLFFAERNPNGNGEGFDNGRVGVVRSFPVLQQGTFARITLSPLEDVGFTANRKDFCLNFNTNLRPGEAIFCPDLEIEEETDDRIDADPQGAFPNQLFSALIRGRRLFVPNIGASPAPPVVFNVNVQALVHVVNTETFQEEVNCHVNLNADVAQETPPASEPGTLQRAFGNDIVAIDANRPGTDFLIVSRGGNYVFRASRDGCQLTLNPPNVVRFSTGNLPNGVVISRDGTRAYVNNEVDISVTRIDLEAGRVIPGDIPSGTPPAPGTFEHAVLVGKLCFFTALGCPDEDNFGTPIRRSDPVANRGKASRDAWSGCASCHPDGLTDNVTWIFGTGPRSTIDMSAFFSKLTPADQRISNWSGVMGSVTDFNNNARGVQSGIGFAGNPPNPNIFQHGLTEGGSEALDLITLWVQTIRPLIMPNPSNREALNNGRTVFANNCATCHGGPKWTKSEVIYDNNPTFTEGFDTADLETAGALLEELKG